MTEYLKATRETAEVRRGMTHFNVYDQKKRVVGQLFRIYEVTFTPAPDASGTWSRRADLPLHFFEVHTHATRNGQTYGATQHAVEFATLEEAVALVEKRIVAARKREVKRWTKYAPAPAMEA